MARSAESAGAWSRTRTESLHYRCPCGALFVAEVHRVVNATRDPALADRLRGGTLGRVTCPACAQPSDVQVPVLYHDELGRRLVLVLPTSFRHRELEERAELLLALARDKSHALPAYVVDFAVVFGGDGLAAYIEPAPAPVSVDAATAPEEPAAFADEGAVRTVIDDVGDSTNRLALAKERSRLPDKDEAVERWALSRAATSHAVAGDEVRLLLKVGERVPAGTLDVRLQLHRLPSYPLLAITVAGVAGADSPEHHAVFFDVENGDDRHALGLLAQAFHLVLDFYDEEYDPVTRREVVLPLAANVRYALTVADEQLAQLPEARRSFEAAVAAWRASGFDRFGRRDPRLEEDSFAHLPSPGAVQQALGVVAGWSEPSNEDYLLLVRSFPVEWWRAIRGRVVGRAVAYGLVLPGPLMDVALAESPLGSRRELVARLLGAFGELCAHPADNDLGPDQIAANWRALFILCEEEGVPVDARVADVARQTPGVRPPLVVVQPRRLDDANVPSLNELVAAASGSRLVRPAARAAHEETNRVAAPLDEDLSHDSPLPLALALGAESAARSTPLRPDYEGATVAELLDLLDDKDLRLGAALELVRRGDPLAVGPVFGAIRRMTRGEAVRVLPVVIRFGEHATPHLVDGLRSRKAYLRQGCALALGVMKSAEGIDPLCDLLAGEPTEVWKEVARALGEIGAGAIMPLALRLRGPDAEDPDIHERVAWALAHVAAKGGRAAVESLAAGRDVAAAGAARRALELAGAARDNDAQVRGRAALGDVTVNRAFSMKFFEAMNGPPRAEPATLDSGSVVPIVEDESGENSVLEADAVLIEDEDIFQG